jgi:hypothetical protein
MSEKTSTSSPSSGNASMEDSTINVIEHDIELESGGRGDRNRASVSSLDASTMDAVAARRHQEFEAARARLRERAVWDESVHARPRDADGTATRGVADGPPDDNTQDRGSGYTRVPLDQPPEPVKKRYLRTGYQYFLKDAPYQLAFEDLGPFIVTEHNRPDIVESMVDMVQAKEWRSIRVSGHEAFRREAWLRATLLGIEVSGYEPKAADLARLSEGRRDRLNNRIEERPDERANVDASGRTDATPSAPQTHPVDQEQSVHVVSTKSTRPIGDDRGAEALAEAAPSLRANGKAGADQETETSRYAGELIEHGNAPYQHNPARSASYYVVYRDQAGTDHVVWGVDLDRAIAESGARPGQSITLENLGKRWVTIDAPVFDAAGVVIGKQEKEVYRNTWEVDVLQPARPSQPRPLQPQNDGRSTDSRSSELGATEPDPAKQPAPRNRNAALSEEERAMHLAVVVAAMREQGFSDRSISRVQMRAARMLDALHSEGIAVPTPKVYDPKAPSTRDRRARSAPDRVAGREMERVPADPSPPAL